MCGVWKLYVRERDWEIERTCSIFWPHPSYFFQSFQTIISRRMTSLAGSEMCGCGCGCVCVPLHLASRKLPFTLRLFSLSHWIKTSKAKLPSLTTFDPTCSPNKCEPPLVPLSLQLPCISQPLALLLYICTPLTQRGTAPPHPTQTTYNTQTIFDAAPSKLLSYIAWDLASIKKEGPTLIY